MEEQNPWWRKEVDEDYESWLNSEIKWIPNIIEKITLNPFSLHFLVGPRQIGKTTLLKIFIYEKLLKKGRDPKSIFYYSCDELSDFKELGEVLDNYISARKEWKIKNSVIILDEITFVKEWFRALKARIDRKLFKSDVLIVTGSTSIEILKERERFPGRRGNGKDIFFYPMSFSEYVEKFGKVKLKKISFNNIDEIERVIKANKIFSNSVSELFLKYLKSGGFPLAIIDIFSKGKISIKTIKTYLDWIKNDWNKAGKNEKYMKEIISYIIRARLSPISWLNIAKETSINSPHTAQDYIKILEDMFCVKVLNIVSPDLKILHRKNKKIHIFDPFLYKVFSYYTKEKVLEENIVESLVCSHLSRVSETYFWKNKSEVDIIAIKNKEQIGFEVKWSFKTWRKPKHLKKIFVLDKEKIPLFLSSILW